MMTGCCQMSKNYGATWQAAAVRWACWPGARFAVTNTGGQYIQLLNVAVRPDLNHRYEFPILIR